MCGCQIGMKDEVVPVGECEPTVVKARPRGLCLSSPQVRLPPDIFRGELDTAGPRRCENGCRTADRLHALTTVLTRISCEPALSDFCFNTLITTIHMYHPDPLVPPLRPRLPPLPPPHPPPRSSGPCRPGRGASQPLFELVCLCGRKWRLTYPFEYLDSET